MKTNVPDVNMNEVIPSEPAMIHEAKGLEREFIRVDTSTKARRLDVSSLDGWVVFAVAINIITLMILFFLSKHV